MDSQQKKELRGVVTVICLLVLVAICGYVAGRRENNSNYSPFKKTIDSLTIVSGKQTAIQRALKDSLRQKDEQKINNIFIINEVKKTIRNEISKTRQTIFALPDSAIQYHVDSIRSAGGFIWQLDKIR